MAPSKYTPLGGFEPKTTQNRLLETTVFGSNPPSGVYSEETMESFYVDVVCYTQSENTVRLCVSERNHIPTRTKKNPGRADFL